MNKIKDILIIITCLFSMAYMYKSYQFMQVTFEYQGVVIEDIELRNERD